MENDSQSRKGENSNHEYISLKSELIEIAAILEKFPGDLRPTVFDLLLGTYQGRRVTSSTTPTETASPRTTPVSSEEEGKAEVLSSSPKEPKIRKKAPDTYSIDPDLNLHGGNGVPSFEQFVGEKKPNSNAEFNTVAVYYLTRVLKQPKASLKDVWTCYKDVKRRTPDFFKQSFTDTKNKTGNIKITDEGDLEISGRGENFVEHDLPPKEVPKK
jgi:hypothetical protein